MKTLALITLLLLSVEVTAHTVTGAALLDTGSDHSGITVNFIGVSPSAVNASSTTGADGNYTAVLVSGSIM
jgi:hypothetical protein